MNLFSRSGLEICSGRVREAYKTLKHSSWCSLFIHITVTLKTTRTVTVLSLFEVGLPLRVNSEIDDELFKDLLEMRPYEGVEMRSAALRDDVEMAFLGIFFSSSRMITITSSFFVFF